MIAPRLITDHFSGPGSAIESIRRLCVCVFVRYLSNEITFDLNTPQCGGLTWLSLGSVHMSRSGVKFQGHRWENVAKVVRATLRNGFPIWHCIIRGRIEIVFYCILIAYKCRSCFSSTLRHSTRKQNKFMCIGEDGRRETPRWLWHSLDDAPISSTMWP